MILNIKLLKNTMLAALLFVVMYACNTSNPPQENNELKVLSWNVWHEGHFKAYGQKASDAMIGILKQSKADAIIMVETYGASDMVADSLGFYHRLLSSNLSIYSRYPIVETYTFNDSISTFNFGGVKIDVDGKPIRVFATWIHYLPDCRLTPTQLPENEILAWDDAGTRDEETRTILNVLKPFLAEADSIPVIMGGDFNSHSHLDWTEATKDLYHHGGAVVHWTVSRLMAEAGFKDSFREVHPDPTEYIGTTWMTEADSLETPNRQDRIDYIYYQGKPLKAVASDCIDNEVGKTLSFEGKDFFYPSDHGFVLTTFRYKAQ